MAENYFQELFDVNVNDNTESRGGLTYLSWAWAWAEAKKRYPDMEYEVVKFDGLPYIYDEKTGYMVYTKVTIEEMTHEMWLPVMDSANKAMKSTPYKYPVKNPNFKYATRADDGKFYDKYGKEQPEYIEKTCEAATMFDINKTIMRCLTKNLAMHGLGLYIYAGEDLPEVEKKAEEDEKWNAIEKEIRELYQKAGGEDFEAYAKKNGFAPGINAEQLGSIKASLKKRITENSLKEKK